MVANSNKWHYLAGKRLSPLFKRIRSNHDGDLNCLRSFRTKNKLNNHKNASENHDYCHIEIPKETSKILKYKQVEKSMKAPFVVYADLECLL